MQTQLSCGSVLQNVNYSEGRRVPYKILSDLNDLVLMSLTETNCNVTFKPGGLNSLLVYKNSVVCTHQTSGLTV